jgi:uncharacterized protein
MTTTNIQNIPLFPLTNGLFPDTLLRLNIFEVRYLDLIKKCDQNKTPFGVVFIEKGSEVQAAGKTPSLLRVGTLAHVQVVNKVQPGLLQIECLGGLRFELQNYELGAYGVWYANVNYLSQDSIVDIPAKLQPVADKLGQVVAQAQKMERDGDLPFTRPYRLDESGWVANRFADLLPIPTTEKHELLAQNDPVLRLGLLAEKIGL